MGRLVVLLPKMGKGSANLNGLQRFRVWARAARQLGQGEAGRKPTSAPPLSASSGPQTAPHSIRTQKEAQQTDTPISRASGIIASLLQPLHHRLAGVQQKLLLAKSQAMVCT